jgi:hypothetical protein
VVIVLAGRERIEEWSVTVRAWIVGLGGRLIARPVART